MRTSIQKLSAERTRGPRNGLGWTDGGRTKPAQNLPTQGQFGSNQVLIYLRI